MKLSKYKKLIKVLFNGCELTVILLCIINLRYGHMVENILMFVIGLIHSVLLASRMVQEYKAAEFIDSVETSLKNHLERES